MIYYLVTAKHSYTMESYLETYGRSLQDQVKLVYYEELPYIGEMPLGTYIFSDLERLSPAQITLAAYVWNHLAQLRPSVRQLNSPRLTMRRFELQKELHRSGINCFQTIRASELYAPFPFPVFIREESEHTGSLTDVLHREQELTSALGRLLKEGHRLENLLVVEFCDTSDAAGVYRKYSAFVVGGEIVPRHLIFSRSWVLKTADLGTGEMLQEERDYLEKNPHEAWLRDIFALASVEYGRIDYSFLGNKPQIWEINTNPMVLMRPKDYAPVHHPGQEYFARLILPAFEKVNSPQNLARGVRVLVPQKIRRDLPGEPRTRSIRRFAKNVKNKVLGRPNVGVVTRHSAGEF